MILHMLGQELDDKVAEFKDAIGEYHTTLENGVSGHYGELSLKDREIEIHKATLNLIHHAGMIVHEATRS